MFMSVYEIHSISTSNIFCLMVFSYTIRNIELVWVKKLFDKKNFLRFISILVSYINYDKGRKEQSMDKELTRIFK